MIDINKMYEDKQFKVNKTDEYSYLAGASDVLFTISNNIKEEIKILDNKLKKIEIDKENQKDNAELKDFFEQVELKTVFKKSSLVWVLKHCL